MDYTILVAENATELSTRVNNLIENGWEPQGGVAIAPTQEGAEEPSRELWTQAMVKRSDS